MNTKGFMEAVNVTDFPDTRPQGYTENSNISGNDGKSSVPR